MVEKKLRNMVVENNYLWGVFRLPRFEQTLAASVFFNRETVEAWGDGDDDDDIYLRPASSEWLTTL